MCSGPEQSKSKSDSSQSGEENKSNSKNMNQLTIETEDSFSSLLELAANNDVDGFNRSIEKDASAIDEVGLWYVRKKGSKQIANEYRTPLMVAATYGSIDVLKIILSHPEVDVNRSAGKDKCTALHSAAAGGSVNSVDTVKLLLSVGADPNLEDADGQRAVDLIVTPPKLPSIKASLEELLTNTEGKLCVSITDSTCSSPTLSSSPVSPSDLISSPMMKKEYPIDPSLPDIKNSIYSTDEFRMFSFKVRPCSRAYSHDWTECPFVHPGENARRRDPRKYHYSCVPCPDFRKGACRRGDMCEYAHGVFECWLHPAQYRTRLCKDGISCARRVCFFAHKTDELRPLFVSTGSAVMSPRSPRSAAMDMAAALALLPGSPGQQISPSSMGWPQPNVPTLHLPMSNLQQSSRLRSSLSARDLPPDDFADLAGFSSQSRQNSVNMFSRSGRSKNLTPSNLDELFSAEIAASSPRYSDPSMATAGVFSPSHKSALLSQFQQQQSVLLPVNTNFDHPLYQGSYGGSSPHGIMSPRSMDPNSPMGASRLCAFNQREMQQHQQLRSLSSRDLGSNYNNSSVVGSPVDSWSKWSTPNGKVDWSVNGDERVQLQKSCSFGLNRNGEEPDLSWVQSLVKESPPEMKEKVGAGQVSGVPSGENMKPNSQIESIDHSVLGAWLEQMQLDQLVA